MITAVSNHVNLNINISINMRINIRIVSASIDFNIILSFHISSVVLLASVVV